MTRWMLYTTTLGFAVYWASNLILWFPWSYSSRLGMILMFTISPILWAYTTFLCLKTYPSMSLIKGAVIVSLILLLIAVMMDYIFFGLIRKAIEQLYHPTTFYGYGFLISLPFIIAFLFKKRITRHKKIPTNIDFIRAGASGVVCLGVLTLIIVFKIEI